MMPKTFLQLSNAASIKLAKGVEAAVDVGLQFILKAAAVQALEHDLAELAQDHFMHWCCSPHFQ